MNFKKLLGLALVSALALTGCKEEKAATAAPTEPAKPVAPLKIGVMTGPEAQMTEVAVKIAKEKYGLDVQLVQFTEYTQPNAALHAKDLDANAFQTVPYLEQESKDRGYKMAVIGNTFVWPIAAYSKKIKNIAELPDGATVAIPNNASNTARALLLLQAHGLLKLKDPKNVFSTENDIIENPKNIKITQVETSLLTRALDDVDLAIINNTYAGQAGLSPDKDGVIVESKDSPYVNLIVSREDNKGDERLQTFVKAFQTEEVYQEALKLFNGGVVKGW
ncbi:MULTISPECIES: MetQ/NlpA family ABC transporter substrate-binding protein [Glaesserella]|uniref:Lipoprotein n=1 Tax=Glaesserella australis TaxID=2094024 RepID=A0A328BV81_9PAST|nr:MULTISPECIES: MetQ/NlpA family lipoprotein [Glaesserella]AUI66062.1 methionine ABC transporter substrate-binding protein MetQ [Glaesserella sp. 15-184]RAL18218.1 methionine ABC transporter substrate-binding protein MetQ [Glaesserella australis]